METAGDPCSGGDKPFKIYLLTPGKPADLRPVITLPGLIDEFTASADGGTLAYLAEQCKNVAGTARRGQQGVALVLNADGQTMYLITAPANQSVAMTETLSAYDVATGTRLRTLHAWSGVQGQPVIVADGTHALVLGMHLTSIDEVNLDTGSAATFRQLRDVLAVAW